MRLGDFRLTVSGVLLLLAACSPSPNDQPRRAPSSSTMMDVTEAELLNEGWRPGTLEIRVMVEQGGTLREETTAGGGTETSVEWSFNLSAQRLLEVLVAPDLSQQIPATGSADARHRAVNRSPVYMKPLVSQPAPRGQASYSKQLSIDSPGSDNYSHLQETTQGQGDVQSVRIANLRPSFYGQGYEFELLLSYHMLMNSTKIAQPVNGAVTHVEEELPVEESLVMHLFPAPDLHVLESYPFASPTSSSRNASSPRQLAMDTFRALQDAAAGVTLIGELRPGMLWEGKKDQLTLSYSLSGNSQPPLFGDITGLATRIEPNRVEVNVIIKAL